MQNFTTPGQPLLGEYLWQDTGERRRRKKERKKEENTKNMEEQGIMHLIVSPIFHENFSAT